jgi:hypothetical protein
MQTPFVGNLHFAPMANGANLSRMSIAIALEKYSLGIGINKIEAGGKF